MTSKQLLFVQLGWRVVAAALALSPLVSVALAVLYGPAWLALAPVVPLAFWALARKTSVKTTHFGQPDVQRYRLPSWLAWAETPDEHLPGGLYEPTVAKIYNRFGWVVCSLYWLLLRNVGQGLLWPRGLLIGPIYSRYIDTNNADVLAAVRAQILIDNNLLPTYWGPFKFYYELVKDWYGEHSGRPDDDWRAVDYVAVLRLGVR